VFLSSGPRLPAEVGSDAATCPMTLGSSSPRGELRRCHVFSNFGTSRGPTVDIFMLVVGAPGPSAPAPPGGPLLTFSRWWWALPELQLRHLPGARRRRFHVGGGRSRTFSSDTSRGPLSMFSRWWWALLDLQLQHLPGPAVDVFTLIVGEKIKITEWGIKKLAPPVGSQPLPRIQALSQDKEQGVHPRHAM
jgi:hypothetical protein